MQKHFEDWFKEAALLRIADAGFTGLDARDAKWQLMNEYRAKGEDHAKRLLRDLIDEKLGRNTPLYFLNDYYSLRRH